MGIPLTPKNQTMKHFYLTLLLALAHLIPNQTVSAQFISRGTGISESGRVIISLSTVDEQTAWGGQIILK